MSGAANHVRYLDEINTKNGVGTGLTIVIPWQALSWHRVQLPLAKRLRGAALQTVLTSLLEEQLGQEPSEVHYFLQAQWQAPTSVQKPVWVGVCNKSWLIEVLTQAQVWAKSRSLKIQAIVPEVFPAQTNTPQALDMVFAHENDMIQHALDTPQSAWLVQNHRSHWPQAQPIHTQSLQLSSLTQAFSKQTHIYSEPLCAEVAEKLAPGRVRVLQRHELWQQQAQQQWGGWRIAQFDLTHFQPNNVWAKFVTSAKVFATSANWRWVRAGLLALILVQVLGMASWHWRERQAANTQKAAIASILTRSFPGEQLVIDAPLQMQRALGRLRQSSGQLSRSDLETMLDKSSLPGTTETGNTDNTERPVVIQLDYAKTSATPNLAELKLRYSNDKNATYTATHTENIALDGDGKLQQMQVWAAQAHALQTGNTGNQNPRTQEQTKNLLQQLLRSQLGEKARLQVSAEIWTVQLSGLSSQALPTLLQSLRKQLQLLPQRGNLVQKDGVWTGQLHYAPSNP